MQEAQVTAQKDEAISVLAPVDGALSQKLPRLPAPRPMRSLYYWTLLLGFLRYPKRALNYLRFKRAPRTRVLQHLPIKLDIEPVSRCNFHCTMCQVSDWPKYKRAEDIKLPEFKALIDEQYGVTELKLQGLGEPLLARDAFFEMIRYARSKFIWVRTTTNASLLHLHDNYKKLIDSGINEVQISFDGATKEVFETIRRGSIFEKVVENCTLINAYCQEKNVLRTRMWVLVQEHNISQFLDFVGLAKQMGFRRLTYSLDLIGWAIDEWIDVNRSSSAKARVTRAMTEEAMRLGREYGVEVTFWNATDKYTMDDPKHLCGWAWERAYVSSDMRIVPCCMIGNPDVYELGNAEAFTAAWNSPAYQEFRAAHLEKRIPKVCEICYDIKRNGAVKPSAPRTSALPIVPSDHS